MKMKREARILVVDDEQYLLDMLKRTLEDEGHEVDCATDGNSALALLIEHKPDLVLLDIKLPGMSGIDIYEHIQRSIKSLARKVIFITGDVMNRDTATFLSRTRASYITKPLDTEQLKKDIDRIISQ